MSRNVSVDQMAAAIAEELDKYNDLAFLEGDALVHSPDLHAPSLKPALTDGSQDCPESTDQLLVVGFFPVLI